MGFTTNLSYNTIFSGLSISNISSFNNTIDSKDKLSIILIEKGIGQVVMNDKVIYINSPTLICLNNKEFLDLNKNTQFVGKVLSFTPSVLKSTFTLINVKDLDHSFTCEDIGLVMLLSIFFKRYTSYSGYITTSPTIITHLIGFVESMAHIGIDCHSASQKLCVLLKYISKLVTTYSIVCDDLVNEISFEVKDIIIYLHNHYKQKITIPELSKIFHVNRTTLSDRFFEATGETIITYLNKHRINVSSILLRESKLTISEISEEVGFNDTAYFAKLFKKYMHLTPSGYRQKYYSLII